MGRNKINVQTENLNVAQSISSDRSDLASSCTDSHLGSPDIEEGNFQISSQVSSELGTQLMQDDQGDRDREEDFLFLSPTGNSAISQVTQYASIRFSHFF